MRSNEDERSDERIMAAYAAGDREAFRELFRRYAQRLHGFLYHMSGDRHLAQDLVQETFLRVHRARAAYDSARPFRPWIFRIAANVHADLARSWFWRLRARTLSLLAEGPGGASAPADRLAAGPATEAWAGAERAQTAALLRRELAALPAPRKTTDRNRHRATPRNSVRRSTANRKARTLMRSLASGQTLPQRWGNVLTCSYAFRTTSPPATWCHSGCCNSSLTWRCGCRT